MPAQSSIDAVSKIDCDTSASVPGMASPPATEALSCNCGRWKPSELGPAGAPFAPGNLLERTGQLRTNPLDSTSALRHAMRPASSSADAMSCGGRAMMARSARACARSANVPLV